VPRRVGICIRFFNLLVPDAESTVIRKPIWDWRSQWSHALMTVYMVCVFLAHNEIDCKPEQDCLKCNAVLSRCDANERSYLRLGFTCVSWRQPANALIDRIWIVSPEKRRSLQ
jgi:hypothetical protein